MSSKKMRIVVLACSVAVSLAPVSEMQACCFSSWFSPAPVVPTMQQVNYVPQTTYRTMYRPTPVTSYRPVVLDRSLHGLPGDFAHPGDHVCAAARHRAGDDLSSGHHERLDAGRSRALLDLCPVLGLLKLRHRRLRRGSRDDLLCTGRRERSGAKLRLQRGRSRPRHQLLCSLDKLLRSFGELCCSLDELCCSLNELLCSDRLVVCGIDRVLCPGSRRGADDRLLRPVDSVVRFASRELRRARRGSHNHLLRTFGRGVSFGNLLSPDDCLPDDRLSHDDQFAHHCCTSQSGPGQHHHELSGTVVCEPRRRIRGPRPGARGRRRHRSSVAFDGPAHAGRNPKADRTFRHANASAP